MLEGQVRSIPQVLTDRSCLQSSGSHLCVPEAHGIDGNIVRVAQTFLDSPAEDVSHGGHLLVHHVAHFWGYITANKVCLYYKRQLPSIAHLSCLLPTLIRHTLCVRVCVCPSMEIPTFKQNLDTNQHNQNAKSEDNTHRDTADGCLFTLWELFSLQSS